ncbi:hypothetical protein N9X38_03395 [Gammaproteobacteria bacterium]|nr:hypothetical protein [Gammaproteobacteria bacterium]
MKYFFLITFLLFIYSCSQGTNNLDQNINDLDINDQKIIEGPFLIREGILYSQETNKPATGIVEIDTSSLGLSERKTYKNGALNGPYDVYLSNGQLLSRENYIAGKKHGLSEFFYHDGQLQERKIYKNGKMEGLLETFDSKGNIISKITVKNNKYAYKKGYAVTGVLEEEGSYKDEKQHGIWKYYDDKKNIKLKKEFMNGEVLSEIAFSYHDNGFIKFKGYRKDSKFNGYAEWFSSDGSMRMKGNLKDNYLNGWVEGYYPNGQKEFRRHYNDGEIEINLSSYFDLDGQSLINGSIYYYYPNNQLMFDYVVKNGMRNGLYQRFYQSGQVYLRRNYIDGKIVGLDEEFDEDGNLIDKKNEFGIVK